VIIKRPALAQATPITICPGRSSSDVKLDDTYSWVAPWRKATFALTTIEAKERLDRYRSLRHPNVEPVQDLAGAVIWLRDKAGLAQKPEPF
jgi:hypothetical protein